jgi:hypothetical protein
MSRWLELRSLFTSQLAELTELEGIEPHKAYDLHSVSPPAQVVCHLGPLNKGYSKCLAF